MPEEPGGDDQSRHVRRNAPDPRPGPAAARCPGSPAGPWRWPRAVPVRRRRGPAAGRRAAAGRRRRRIRRCPRVAAVWCCRSRRRGRRPAPVTEGILPLGGADHHRAVRPGHEVDRYPADQSPHRRGQQRPQFFRHPEPEDVAVDRPQRQAGVRRAGPRARRRPGRWPQWFPLARTVPPPARLAPATRPSAQSRPAARRLMVWQLPRRQSGVRSIRPSRRRGSTWWSAGMSKAQEMPGLRKGSRTRASRTVSGSTARPCACWTARRSASARRSAASAPTARVGVVRYPCRAAPGPPCASGSDGPSRPGPALSGHWPVRRRTRARGWRIRA